MVSPPEDSRARWTDTASRARSSSSTVTSASRSTTGRPLTSSSSSGGGAPSTRAATGSAMPACGERVEPPQREVGELARLQRADLGRPGRAPGAAERGHLEARRGRSAPAGRRGPGEQQRVPQLLDQRGRLVGRGAVDAEPDRARRRRAGRGPGAMPAPSRALDDGQCATPVPVGAESCDRVVVEVDARGRTRRRARASPGDSTYSTGRQPNCSRQNSSSSRVSARWVCSRTPLPPGQRGRLAQQVGGHRERRAGRDRRPAASSRATGRGSGRSPSSVAARIASRSSTTWSGGSPPWLGPRSIEPRVGWKRSPTRARPPRSRRRAGRRRRAGKT